MFLEKCKYVVKEQNMSNYITDDIKSSDDSDYSDEENVNG